MGINLDLWMKLCWLLPDHSWLLTLTGPFAFLVPETVEMFTYWDQTGNIFGIF